MTLRCALAVAAMILGGCAGRIPAPTLDALRADPQNAAGRLELPIAYQRAVDCFENSAQRISIDGENSTNITVLPDISTARITVVSYGRVYVLIDLVATGPTSARAVAFAVQPFRDEHVSDWLALLSRCP